MGTRDMRIAGTTFTCVLIPLGLGIVPGPSAYGEPHQDTYQFLLTVTSELPFPNVPMDPVVDFAQLMADADIPGFFDPNSVSVVDSKTGQTVPHALSDDFAYGDKGRVEWVIRDPSHTLYQVCFRTAPPNRR